MFAFRLVKFVFVIAVCALLAIASFAPDQVLMNGLWWVPGFVISWGIPLPVLAAVNLFGLLLSAALPIAFLGYFDKEWTPHASTATIYLLNPLAIFIWFAQDPLWLSIYLFIPRVALAVYILWHVIFGKRESDSEEVGEDGVVRVVWWKPALTVLGLLGFGLMLVSNWTSFTGISAQQFVVGDLLAARFASIWLEYWNSSVLYLLIAILAVLFLVRVLVRFSKVSVGLLLGSVLGMGVVFVAIVVALPALQGNFVSPDMRVKDVPGLTGLVGRLAGLGLTEGQNVLLIQNNLEHDNIFLSRTNDIFPLIDHLLWGRVIATSARDADQAYTQLESEIGAGNVSLELLNAFGVHYVAVIEPGQAEVYTANLDNLFGFARSNESFPELQVTTAVERRAFLFENRSYSGQRITRPNELALSWKYEFAADKVTRIAQAERQTKVVLPAATQFVLAQSGGSAGGQWRLRLVPSSSSATVNGQTVQLSGSAQNVSQFDSSRRTFYLVANEKSLGEISASTKLDFNDDILRTVRLYGRYDNTNLLELADFAGVSGCGGATPRFTLQSNRLQVSAAGDTCLVVGSPEIEARSSLLLELKHQARLTNATLRVCLYDLADNTCVLESEGADAAATRESDPLFRRNLQVRVYLNRNNLGSEISADISQLRLREYELAKFESLSILPPKSTLIDVQRGDRVRITSAIAQQIDIDVLRLSSCTLDLSEVLNQTIGSTSTGLEVAGQPNWCLQTVLPESFNAASTPYLLLNGQQYTSFFVEGRSLYLVGMGALTIDSLELITS